MSSFKSDSKCEELRKEGNQLYQQKKYTEALVCYNKALCYAKKIDSKEAAFCFANRSAVYLELKLPEACLENIELARNAGYPAEKILDTRKDKCREMIDTKDPAEEYTRTTIRDFFKLAYPAHEKLPSLANCIEMRDNKKFGRGFHATQDLKAGEVIAVSEPVMKALFMNGIYKRCTNCLKMKSMNLMPCSGCVSAMFCSKECQNEAMEKFHQFECAHLDSLSHEDDDFPSLSRTFLEARHAAGGLDKLKALCFDKKLRQKTIFDYDLSKDNNPSLELNQLKAALSIDVYHSRIAGVREFEWINQQPMRSAWRTLKEKEDIKQILMRLYPVYWCPVLEPMDELIRSESLLNHTAKSVIVNRSFGTALNLMTDYIYHSCSPNVSIIQMEVGFAIVTFTPIMEGEPIFACYG